MNKQETIDRLIKIRDKSDELSKAPDDVHYDQAFALGICVDLIQDMSGLICDLVERIEEVQAWEMIDDGDDKEPLARAAAREDVAIGEVK